MSGHHHHEHSGESLAPAARDALVAAGEQWTELRADVFDALATHASPASAYTSVYDFTVNNIDGKPVKLDAYKGKVVLIVNVASKCGYTPQYEGLQATYAKYKDRGLVILGFPANNFMGQEPGTNEEIKQFCSLKYNVTFPLFAKISVKGEDKH